MVGLVGILSAMMRHLCMLWAQAMSLALQCLSFDFVGTCLDESAEDLGTIQVHTNQPLHMILLYITFISMPVGYPGMFLACVGAAWHRKGCGQKDE